MLAGVFRLSLQNIGIMELNLHDLEPLGRRCISKEVVLGLGSDEVVNLKLAEGSKGSVLDLGLFG
jgi:hypothetical protein